MIWAGAELVKMNVAIAVATGIAILSLGNFIFSFEPIEVIKNGDVNSNR